MISRIEASNFKCFKNLSLDLSNLNLFSGVNSMGKSTVIQLLLLLRQSYEQRSLEKGIYLNGRYVNLGVGKDVLYTEALENYIEIAFTNEDSERFQTRYAYNKASDFLKLENKIDIDTISHSSLFGRGFYYIAADRLGPQNSYEKSYYEVWDNNQLGMHGEYAVHYLQEHAADKIEDEYVLHDGSIDNNLLIDQIESWMGEITPGVSLRTEDYGHSNRISLMVHQKSNNGAEYFTAQNVGFGISYVLPIVLALLKAKEGDLVILENPEAHIHPRGQRKMGELIARASQGGVQIIVETHSDHILNGIRLSANRKVLDPELVKLYFFTRQEVSNGEEKILVPKIENPILKSDGRLSFWPDGFFDEWDYVIDNLF